MIRSIFKALMNNARASGRLAFCTRTSRFDNEDYNVSSSDSEGSSSDDTNVKDIKKKILTASLPFVHQHGWTEKSLALGAEKVNLSSMSHGMFPSGGYEIVGHFYRDCNEKLVEMMKEVVAKEERIKTREFIEEAMKYRLNLITPYISRWPEAMVLMVQPWNVLDSFGNFSSMIDDAWYHAGDRSYDMTWYTKRSTLAVVYKSTELCLLRDESKDFEETWSFLSDRMRDIENLEKCSKQAEVASDFVKSIFQVGKNILSMNGQKRR